MAHGSEMPQINHSEDKFTSFIWKLKLDSPSDRIELFYMGGCMLHFQLSHSPESISMVEQIYYDFVCSIGFGTGIWTGGSLFWFYIFRSDERIQLVGY